jgi:hypothetical protein
VITLLGAGLLMLPVFGESGRPASLSTALSDVLVVAGTTAQVEQFAELT